MKLLFRPLEDPLSTLGKDDMKTEELQLPHHIMLQLHSDLRSSNEMMPKSARQIQNWDVGFLQS